MKKIESVTNTDGQAYQYTTSRLTQSIQIKIGDPNKTISGKQTYVIKYQIKDILMRYKDFWEVYWSEHRL